MADRDFESDVFRELSEQEKTIGQFAEDENAFREACEAFRAYQLSIFFLVPAPLDGLSSSSPAADS